MRACPHLSAGEPVRSSVEELVGFLLVTLGSMLPDLLCYGAFRIAAGSPLKETLDTEASESSVERNAFNPA